MGSRASYVIVQDGRPEAYFARWGGQTVDQALVAGPQGAVEFIRLCEAADDIMDNIWAEGGIAIDLDRKVLRFFSWMMKPSHLRRVLRPAIQAIWAGLDVAWAEHGIVDIASHFGWEADRVLDSKDSANSSAQRAIPATVVCSTAWR